MWLEEKQARLQNIWLLFVLVSDRTDTKKVHRSPKFQALLGTLKGDSYSEYRPFTLDDGK